MTPPSATVESATTDERVRKVRYRRAVVLAVLLTVIGEGVGRSNGLHHPVVYERTEYGYRALPNQDLRRFGNHVRYNEFGLRNEPVAALPAADATRVLCVGDSVANGGAITDQDQTISYQLAAILRQRHREAEVLNASAPGWAIANELGWLRTFGTFGSQRVVLIMSTHDLFQELAPAAVAGSHPSFPTEAPVFALQNVVVQYLLPRVFPEGGVRDPGAAGVESSERQARQNRNNVLAIADLVRSRGAGLIVVFLEQEGDNGRDSATLGAKRLFFATMAQEGIPVVTLGHEVETIGRPAMFRDDVHPNPAGNRTIAEAIARELLKPEGVLADAGRPVPR